MSTRAASTAPEVAAAKTPTTADGRRRPLAVVVEDDPELREMIMRVLADVGVEAKGFGNGEEALAFIEMNRAPDLVHLDLVLPWMCGVRVCEAIRYSAHTSHVPIMVVTGRTEMQDEAAALEAGADAFLEKPFKVRDYVTEVRRLLAAALEVEQEASKNGKSTTNNSSSNKNADATITAHP